MDSESREKSERYKEGLRIRSEVLGEAHVSRSMTNSSEFTMAMQELVTEYCWGEVWSRPGISRRDRSLLNIAILTVLNRGHELALHVRGAIANGATPDEIREALLQTAIYAGVPAAIEGFRVADQVLTALDLPGDDETEAHAARD